MSEFTQTHRESSTPLPVEQRSRRRALLLAVLGSLVVALPLLQVLRYQGQALLVLEDQRAALDPMARTVDAQRGVLLHRTLASFVLVGDATAEDRRRTQQRQVDAQLAALDSALSTGRWADARRECDTLRDDWSLLTQQIGSRSIGVLESNAAHRLLVEQLLQIMDLLDPGEERSSADPGDPVHLAWAVVRSLPRLNWSTVDEPVSAASGSGAAAANPSPASDTSRQLAEAALSRLLGRINRSLGSSAPDLRTAWSRTDAGSWARAGAELGNASDRLGQLVAAAVTPVDSQAAPDPALLLARDAVWKAQFALIDLARSDLVRHLNRQQQALERQRGLLLLALVAISTLALLLARPWIRRHVWRPTLLAKRPMTLPLADADEGGRPTQPALRDSTLHEIEARRLFGRLRDPSSGWIDIDIGRLEAPQSRRQDE